MPLSSALQITNVNDFLSPSTACVLPVQGGAQPSVRNQDLVEPPGSVLAPIVPNTTNAGRTTTTTAKVTLSDCLSCSGCVTSADTVLLSTHNTDLLTHFMRDHSRNNTTHYAVAALSQQAVASLALHFNLPLQSTAAKLATFLTTHLHFDTVVDLSFARHISLLESAQEFLQRYQNGHALTVASACPGWLTYAEKTQSQNILSKISTVPSAQAIMGALSRTLLERDHTRKPWLCSIAPCHDKKIEAHRPEFSRDVNCVITTAELLNIIAQSSFDMQTAHETPLDERMSASHSPGFGVKVGSGSDGYADFILRVAARKLLGVQLPPGPLPMQKMSKSGDLKSITVVSEDGSRQLTFATAYGFRSLQSILRKMKRGECTYNYIELMACPGGCNNGGGQIPMPEEANSGPKSVKMRSEEHLNRVEEKFADAAVVEDPAELPNVQRLYSDIGDGPGSAASKTLFTVDVQSRTDAGPTSLSW